MLLVRDRVGRCQDIRDELLPMLPAEWRPNFECNDLERWARTLCLRDGRQEALVFDEAVHFED